MSLRARLLGVSLLTLAVGVGALLVVGNLLLRSGVHTEAQDVLRARAEAQLASLGVTSNSVRVHDTANDRTLDQRAWVDQTFFGRTLLREAQKIGNQVAGTTRLLSDFLRHRRLLPPERGLRCQ